LTGLLFSEKEFVGIVQNQDKAIISFYDIERCRTEGHKKLMLEYGELWWWESNRQLPIDIFLFQEMQQLQYCLRTFILKETDVIFGPITSMQNILKKRIKRRSIQLVKKTI
jgi:hypothetical protein